MTPGAGGADTRRGDVTTSGGVCRLSECKSAAVLGTPLCSEHLKRIRPTPTLLGPDLQGTGIRQSGGGSAAADGITERSYAPSRPRNSVLGASFVMRKSSPNGNMRGPTNSAPLVSQAMYRNGLQPLPPREILESRGRDHGANGEQSRWTGPARVLLDPPGRPPIGVQEASSRKRSIWDFEDDDPTPSIGMVAETTRFRELNNGPHASGRPEQPDTLAERPEDPKRGEEESMSRRKRDLLRRLKERDDALQRQGGGKGTRTWSLDAYIYAQNRQGAAPLPPPPGVVARPSRWSLPTPTSISYPLSVPRPLVVHAPMDPRVHWTRVRSAAWYKAKQEEIKARGGRKANVRKAAERVAKQRRHAKDMERNQGNADDVDKAQAMDDADDGAVHEGRAELVPRQPSVWVGDLPPEVQSNPAWMRLLRAFAQDELRRAN